MIKCVGIVLLILDDDMLLMEVVVYVEVIRYVFFEVVFISGEFSS